MAIRLKVNRAALLAQAETALSAIVEEIATVKQQQASWDWREAASHAVERLTTHLENRKATEKSFDDLWYSAKRGKPGFEHDLRNLHHRKKDLEHFISMLKMNNEELVSVSTADEEVINILRIVRRKEATGKI